LPLIRRFVVRGINWKSAGILERLDKSDAMGFASKQQNFASHQSHCGYIRVDIK
jgi:hypothetical protein